MVPWRIVPAEKFEQWLNGSKIQNAIGSIESYHS